MLGRWETGLQKSPAPHLTTFACLRTPLIDASDQHLHHATRGAAGGACTLAAGHRRRRRWRLPRSPPQRPATAAAVAAPAAGRTVAVLQRGERERRCRRRRSVSVWALLALVSLVEGACSPVMPVMPAIRPAFVHAHGMGSCHPWLSLSVSPLPTSQPRSLTGNYTAPRQRSGAASGGQRGAAGEAAGEAPAGSSGRGGNGSSNGNGGSNGNSNGGGGGAAGAADEAAGQLLPPNNPYQYREVGLARLAGPACQQRGALLQLPHTHPCMLAHTPTHRPARRRWWCVPPATRALALTRASPPPCPSRCALPCPACRRWWCRWPRGRCSLEASCR